MLDLVGEMETKEAVGGNNFTLRMKSWTERNLSKWGPEMVQRPCLSAHSGVQGGIPSGGPGEKNSWGFSISLGEQLSLRIDKRWFKVHHSMQRL